MENTESIIVKMENVIGTQQYAYKKIGTDKSVNLMFVLMTLDI